MASVVTLLLSAGGLFAANTVYPTDAPPAARFLQHLPGDGQAASDRSIVLEQTYGSIEPGDEPLGTSAFLQDFDTPTDTLTHASLHDADDAPLLTRADFPQSPGRFESAFLSLATRQALQDLGDQTFVDGTPRPAVQNEIIPPPSALWSGILMVAGLLVYRLQRKIMYLS